MMFLFKTVFWLGLVLVLLPTGSDKQPTNVPQGAIMEYVANYDNSLANPLNPDPTVPVTWGQQVWEEMHSVWVGCSRKKGCPCRISIPSRP